VRRAEQEEGEERGGGDGSETEGAGLAGRPPWFPSLVGRAPSSSSSRVTASHGVVGGKETGTEGSALRGVAESEDGPPELAVAAQVDGQEPCRDRDLALLSIREAH